MDRGTGIPIHSNTNRSASYMHIYQPYTYIIGWSNHSKWYYGVRYSEDCNPKDMWVTYFTSSKHVREFRKLYGNPDIIEVRKVFSTKAEALLWEEKVLRRMKVRSRDDFLNKTDSHAPPIMRGNEHPLYGIGHTDETKRKMSLNSIGKNKGVPKSEEHRRKISEARKKNWSTNTELKNKFSEKMKNNTYGTSNKGWVPTKENRLRMSNAAKKRTQYVQCDVCGDEVIKNFIKVHKCMIAMDRSTIDKSNETKRKRYENMSDEERKETTRKMWEINVGKKRSEETKKKMSESAKKYWASKKEEI